MSSLGNNQINISEMDSTFSSNATHLKWTEYNNTKYLV